MGFKTKLKSSLKDILSETELDLLPRGFQSIGKIMILKLNPDLYSYKAIIAQKCMELLPSIKAVYLNKGKIEGTFRKPNNMEYIAGENNSLVRHKEHDIIYSFDFTKIMFSQGNLSERKFLATLVKDGEIIVDMFAGIGYFSLPIGKHSKPSRIYSIELNPEAYNYLVENVKLNHLEEVIFPINGDCKKEVVKLSHSGIKAHRVIMGVFPAPKNYIKEALLLVRDEGTTYHYEGVIEKSKYMSLFDDFNKITETQDLKCKLLDKRFVKSYGPHLYHTVLDIFVNKIESSY
ncbi:MAG: class I SAM-dependent methyltransferase family protein [Candidatus Lokiarchaeota archaeon]|nr:class I SAM-dependent methyltransferase family protein [Candidatus Lokiarchaeota archaeon]